MQYHHNYHAGNFADVFKHSILVMLIQHLAKKDKPFLYLDTHAGIGSYDLSAEMAQKTREYEKGIALLYRHVKCHKSKVPPIFASTINAYLDIVCSCNSSLSASQEPSACAPENKNYAKVLPYYPGSPLIARSLLRPCDCMLLVESEEDRAQLLKQEFACDKRIASRSAHQDVQQLIAQQQVKQKDAERCDASYKAAPQIAVHRADGYQSIKALLPPRATQPQRGLVLIDPPFEQPDEFQKIVASLKEAQQRFPNGTCAVWYPIKELLDVKNFYHALRNGGFKNVLISELKVESEGNGGGMIASTSNNMAHHTSSGSGIISLKNRVRANSYGGSRNFIGSREFAVATSAATTAASARRPILASCGVVIINAPWQFDAQLKPMVAWLNSALGH